MINFVQRPRSSRERFADAFGGAAQEAARLIPEHFEQQKQRKMMEERSQREAENIKDLLGEDIESLSPELRKEYFSQALKGREKEKERQFQERSKSNEPTVAEQKFAKEQEDEQRVIQTGQKSFDAIAKLLRKGNVGLGSGLKSKVFGGETARDVGEFNSATGGLEAMLVDMVSRGTLSNTRFEYIKDTLLPKATDRAATIEGKMKGLAKILGLDPKHLLGEENLEEEQQEEMSSIEGSKELNAQVMQKIYKQANGDKEKAKKIAKKMGYRVE